MRRETEENGQTAGYTIAVSLPAGGGWSSRLARLSLGVMATVQPNYSVSASVKLDLQSAFICLVPLSMNNGYVIPGTPDSRL